MGKNIIIIALTLLSVYFIRQTYVITNKLEETELKLANVEQNLNEQIRIAKEKEENEDKKDLLSEWDMFTLALMKVESNYEVSAESSVGAKGYFQIMPIYVEEVNRVHNTNFVYEDVVKSFEQSHEVFTLMQEAHNKDFNMDKALLLHNGDHKWYNHRVYKEMANIARYEEMRQMVKEANSSLI